MNVLWDNPNATLTMWRLLLALGVLGTASSAVFLGLVLVAVRRYRRIAAVAAAQARGTRETDLPPVTILKPVHGMEPRLAQNLESFFQQDYPDFEIIIAARDADNPALLVAEELRRKYPKVRSRVMISGPPAWPSAKVFSLHRMIQSSRDEHFVISDSDVLVGPDFLRNVVPPLLDPTVGLVTCLYQGMPAGGLWSLLEGVGMSVEMPSGVLVADMMEGMRFALGAAMAVRRDALEKIGGIQTTADYYSDDFVLGNEIWSAGFRVVLSHYVVGHVLVPRSLEQTVADQLRWMKSTRYSRPRGHIGTGLTFAVPFGVLGLVSAWALGRPGLGLALLAVTLLNRVAQSLLVGWGVLRDRNALTCSWLYPLRDFMGFFIWGASFTSRSFLWRGETYAFQDGGKIIPKREPEAAVVESKRAPAS
jgi:ceramide glucosyltransferase